MSHPESDFLPLALRSDRGYIYFPDAVEFCLRAWPEENRGGLRAECYKTSSREIYAVFQAGRDFDHRQTGLFGSISWSEGERQKTILLLEAGKENPRRYQFLEPRPDFDVRDGAISWEVDEGLFPSIFHRWTTLSKILYHHAECDRGYRMFLQRIEIATLKSAPGSEKIKLEFMTKDRLLRFSVWHADDPVGEVIAAGRKV